MGLKIFYIIIISIFFYQCNGKADGIIYKKYPDGTISAEIPYLIKDGDTLINGTALYFYQNGNIRSKIECLNGKKNGWHMNYDSLGRIESKVMFRDNKMTGYNFTYYNSGKIEIEELRQDDSIIMLKNFHPNGELKLIHVHYSNKHLKYYSYYDSLGKKIDEEGVIELMTLFFIEILWLRTITLRVHGLQSELG